MTRKQEAQKKQDTVDTNQCLEPTVAHDELASELAAAFSGYVSPTARLLEMGREPGLLSLRLAQAGYRVGVLTHDAAALRRAKQLFARHDVSAELIKADPKEPPRDLKRFDLTWSIGLLEHFEDDACVDLLQAMRRLSRHAIACVVPNFRSLPYWLYRFDRLRRGEWPGGREYPITNLRPLFRSAGMRLCEEVYAGAVWTLDMLADLPGMSAELAAHARESWEQKVIAPEQNALVLAVGQRLVPGARSAPPSRSSPMGRLQRQISELIDTCGQLTHARDEAESQARDRLAAAEQRIAELAETFERRVAELTEALERRSAEHDAQRRRVETLTGRMARKEFEAVTDLQRQLNDRDLKIDTMRQEQSRLLASSRADRDQVRTEMTERLDSAALRLHRVEEARSVRLAQLLRRLDAQMLHGTPGDRRDFLHWCGRKLRRLPTPKDQRFDLFQSVREALQAPADAATPAGSPARAASAVPTEPVPPRPEIYAARNGKYHDAAEALQRFYASAFADQMPAESQTVQRLLSTVEHHAVVVFPPAFSWQPYRRPQQMLRALAERGYLCLFCEPAGPDDDFTIEPVQPRLYRVCREEFLLPVLRNEPVLVYCTWLLQKPFADALPHAAIWYDVAEPLECTAKYDARMRRDHDGLARDAAIVSYATDRLAATCNGRDDAVAVPNAVYPRDFSGPRGEMPEDLASWHRRGVPLIGFTGVMNGLFDHKLVEQVAQQHPEWDMVLIGPAEPGVPVDRLSKTNLRWLGAKPSDELPDYLAHVDVAILPLRLSDLAQALSPVSMYEYLAAGRPVVSTPIDEVKPLERDYIHLAQGAEAFARSIAQCLRDGVKALASRHGPLLVEQHTWPDRVARIERALESSPDGLAVLAPLRHEHEVAVYCPALFDARGHRLRRGGAERCIAELAAVVERTGHRMVVHQPGDAPWVRRVGELEVRSLCRGGAQASDRSPEMARHFNYLFYGQLMGRAALYMYAPFFGAYPYALHPNVGIGHGVAWNDPRASYTNGLDFWAANRNVTESLRLCDRLIAADAATPAWFQTVDYEESRKIRVVPSGVDTDVFAPPAEPRAEGSAELIILYPRRLDEGRGLHLVLEVADDLLEAYDNVCFHFVGSGESTETAAVKELVERWPDRVAWDAVGFERMPDAYRAADITVVPTLYGGSTNLASLEAMASGNAVIGTRVGGSVGLIVDGYNGLLIDASADALRDGLVRLIEDEALRRRIGRSARETAEQCPQDRWTAAWEAVISEHLPSNDEPVEGGRLVVLEVRNARTARQAMGWIIARLLERGDLVYVLDRDENAPIHHSFGRLQWVTAEDVALARPDLWILDTAVEATADAARPDCWVRPTSADPWPESCDEPILVSEPSADGRGVVIRTREALEALGLVKPIGASAEPSTPAQAPSAPAAAKVSS